MLLSQVPQLELVNILNNVDLNNLQVLRKILIFHRMQRELKDIIPFCGGRY